MISRVFKEYFPSVLERQRLRNVAKKKKEEQTSKLVRLRGLYNPHFEPNRKILNMDWDTLIKGLRSRDISAVSVMEAHIGKTVEATSSSNCVTEFNPRAESYARDLDAGNKKASWFERLRQFPSSRKHRKPLFGVPFCVSDEVSVRGMDRTLGSAKKLYCPSKGDAVVVRLLQDLGAIPFCKTNVSQTVLNYGSDNPVFGQTKNPLNTKWSPGGSNSGLGSLIAAKGCLFGVGSDVGGTLRIPAHFTGVSGIMSTPGRLSFAGIESSLPDLLGVMQVPGILARNAWIVAAVFKLIVQHPRQHQYDASVASIPWDTKESVSKRRLKIGYFVSLPFFPPIGDTAQVIERARNVLDSMGHTLIPFHLPDSFAMMRAASNFIFSDNFESFQQLWRNEPVSDGSSLLWIQSKIPVYLQKQIQRQLRENPKFRRNLVFFGPGADTVNEIMDTLAEKEDMRQKVMADWRELGLDVLICPVFPFPAPPLDNPPFVPVAIVYTLIWSFLNFPAGVIPFGSESGERIHDYDDEGDFALKLAKKGIKSSVGAPIGIQVVGLPYKEETILRLMIDLERCRT